MSSMVRPMEQFVKALEAARRVSTPLVSIRTADPALTVARIEEAVGKDAAIMQWDSVRGLVRRLNQVLNGFRAVSAYESLDLSSNLTLRGLHSKNQAGY